ncbi:EH signature domain-containing protein [Anaeromyxobacter sp. SG66]|uniref:EH signature domain-containing protein n=1 Tax=Anaeromyxobacter sp. SG66 TaxID=2925410 RepID=UPI001F560291|nr:EH signature domain-containing protein [Anaeromyxobacter sp. SG66]
MTPDDVAAALRAARDRVHNIGLDTGRRLDQTREAFERRIATVGLAGRPRAPKPVEDLAVVVRRVQEAIARGTAEEVTPRDARVLARNFRSVEPDLLRAVLAARPGAWDRYLATLMRERLTLPPHVWSSWARLAGEAPADVALFNGTINKADLLAPDHRASADAVAHGSRTVESFAQLVRRLCSPGLLDRSWPYTCLVFAAWARLRGDRWPWLWAEVQTDVCVEAMMLPRVGESSWFRSAGHGTQPFPVRIPETIEANVAFADACLAFHLGGGTVNEVAADQLIRILIAAWGDPRSGWHAKTSPQARGWKQFKTIAPTTYDKLLERLFAEDLDLFFETIDFDKERRKFWRKHLKKLVATTFYFSASTRELLTRRFPPHSDMHEKAKSALSRARDLTGSGGLDALVLFFKNGVIVEFSKTGNAAYRYTHEAFATLTRKCGPRATASALKDQRLGNQMSHWGPWQAEFEDAVTRIT